MRPKGSSKGITLIRQRGSAKKTGPIVHRVLVGLAVVSIQVWWWPQWLGQFETGIILALLLCQMTGLFYWVAHYMQDSSFLTRVWLEFLRLVISRLRVAVSHLEAWDLLPVIRL